MPSPFQHILVGIDLTKVSKPALNTAMALAECCGARLTLLHAVDPRTHHLFADAARSPVPVAEPHLRDRVREAEATLRALAAERTESETLPRVRVEAHPNAAEALLEEAEKSDADLIVLGSHQRSGVKRVILGSVCREVHLQATCPVLLTPSAE